MKAEPINKRQWNNILARDYVYFLANGNPKFPLPCDSAAIRLYWGDTGTQQAATSPYLIRVLPAHWPGIADRVCCHPGWGFGWILSEWLAATPPDQPILNHLRSWSWIADEQGLSQLLRIADWAVVSSLLKASSPGEQSEFFGAARALVTIDDGQITTWTADNGHCFPFSEPASQPRMLSPHQYQALTRMTSDRRYQHEQDFLHRQYPETQTWPDEKLSAFILRQVGLANTYGFTSEQHRVKWLSLAHLFGESFATHAWAADILNRQDTGTQDVMNSLFRAAMAEMDREGLL